MYLQFTLKRLQFQHLIFYKSSTMINTSQPTRNYDQVLQSSKECHKIQPNGIFRMTDSPCYTNQYEIAHKPKTCLHNIKQIVQEEKAMNVTFIFTDYIIHSKCSESVYNEQLTFFSQQSFFHISLATILSFINPTDCMYQSANYTQGNQIIPKKTFYCKQAPKLEEVHFPIQMIAFYSGSLSIVKTVYLYLPIIRNRQNESSSENVLLLNHFHIEVLSQA